MSNRSHHDWKLISENTSRLKTAPEDWAQLTAETRNTSTGGRPNPNGVNLHLGASGGGWHTTQELLEQAELHYRCTIFNEWLADKILREK